MCVGASVWLGWSGIRVAGWSTVVLQLLGSMFVGISVWLGWSGIHVAGCNTDTTPTRPHRNSNTHRTNCCCASACNTDTTPTQPHRNSNTHWTRNNMTNAVIQQNSCKLLMMHILMSNTCWAHKNWNKIARVVLQPATWTSLKPSRTKWTEEKTTNVVIQQNSCKLLMMDILMSETCWAHKKWNKITSDIKLVFYFSTIYAVCLSSRPSVIPNTTDCPIT